MHRREAIPRADARARPDNPGDCSGRARQRVHGNGLHIQQAKAEPDGEDHQGTLRGCWNQAARLVRVGQSLSEFVRVCQSLSEREESSRWTRIASWISSAASSRARCSCQLFWLRQSSGSCGCSAGWSKGCSDGEAREAPDYGRNVHPAWLADWPWP